MLSNISQTVLHLIHTRFQPVKLSIDQCRPVETAIIYVTIISKRPPASAAWSFNFHLATICSQSPVETTDFSRVEFQFQPNQGRTKERLKLKLHATKVQGLLKFELLA